jgi:hypothetical protein
MDGIGKLVDETPMYIVLQLQLAELAVSSRLKT